MFDYCGGEAREPKIAAYGESTYRSILGFCVYYSFVMSIAAVEPLSLGPGVRRRCHVVTYIYSLRSSSSGVSFWKNSIQIFILSSEMWKLSCEGCEFLTASRLSSSSCGTSRKCTSLLAPRRFARSLKSSRSSRAQKPKSRMTLVPSSNALLAIFQSIVSIKVCRASCSGSFAS